MEDKSYILLNLDCSIIYCRKLGHDKNIKKDHKQFPALLLVNSVTSNLEAENLTKTNFTKVSTHSAK